MTLPSLTPEQRLRIETAFDSALDLPSAERANWLTAQFEGEHQLLRQVTHLLQMEEKSRGLFAALEGQRSAILGEMLGNDAGAEADPRTGACYGPWRVVSHIGSGGLAEVYEVCRDDGRYEQRAALKILRVGILGQYAHELFTRERRLLAQLDHPGIVRIIDGGETPTGSPWLVMELVEGQTIDVWCREQALDRNARLALLAEAADILSAAHARLVIHGDLKADHVFVNTRGELRLLDFGIAQALDEQGLGRAAEGFSPDYASPEQAEGKRLSTASDIFQLGRIVEQVMGSADGDAALRAVIARATAPDPANRYASIAGLAADLRAIIADDPVTALPDTRGRALMRLVRRNRLAAALGVLLVTGSAGWAVTATLSASMIAHERNAALAAADREQRGKSVLLELFRRADVLEADSLGLEPAAAAAMLEQTLASARGSLADDKLLLADLVNWTARAHLHAGHQARARALAQEEIALLHEHGAHGTLRDGAGHAFLANVLATGGESEAAAGEAEDALAALGSEDPAQLLAADILVAVAWSREGDWAAQRQLFERALAIVTAIEAPMALIEIESGLGRALVGLDELDQARPHVERAIALVRARYGDRHPRLALPLSDLGRLEERAGNAQAAIAAHREALALSEAAFGPSHSSTLAHRNNLALALSAAGKGDASIAEYQRLLQAHTDELARGEVAQNLAASLVQAGQYAQAEGPLTIAERAFAAHLPADHPRRVFPALTRSEMRLAQRRYREAETDARTALALLERVMPEGHFATATARCRIGIALAGQGRMKQADAFIRTAMSALSKAGGGIPARIVTPCRNALARLP